MTRQRVLLAMIGMVLFVVSGAWPSQATAVTIDLGGIHIDIGGRDRSPPPEVVVVERVEVLTRGPIHEAFAQPVILDEGAGFVITRRPPRPLDELVPEEKPEGNHILWIPGYWSWDTDRNDFIWVSGCWRAVPPNTSWVPGYWAAVRGGFEWTAGFWDTADADEIEYLPAPPASLEEGPQGRGSPDSVWIPGCWVRHEGRYAWRPGFWEAAQANWVWEPAHYVSTPRGWIYVEGYWDYPLNRRGVAFLPIYASPSLYGRADFRYSPDVVIDLDGLMVNLFISPERHQYYFGDYYGAEYSRAGFYPWYASREHHDWYDPIYVHSQWEHRDDRQWVERQRTDYDRRRDNVSLRPAVTYEAMRAQAARLPEKERAQVQVARPMKEVVADKKAPMKFAPVDAKTRETMTTQAKDVHAYQDKRSQWETPAAAPPKAGPEPKAKDLTRPPTKDVAPPAARDVQPGKVKIPKSPTAVREPVRDKDLAPPSRPKQPNPDLAAQPKPGKDARDGPGGPNPKGDRP
jgi:hypothetical protein